MAIADKRFEWPIVYETSASALVASKVFEPFLEERRARNREIWHNSQNWRLGFYFGKGDTRLWVPPKPKKGLYTDNVRVINFAHPLGRKAFRVLALGYGIGLVAASMLVAWLCGVRW